jgi:hypothetical protein
VIVIVVKNNPLMCVPRLNNNNEIITNKYYRLAGAGASMIALQKAGFDTETLSALCGDSKQLKRLQDPPCVAIRSVGLSQPGLLKKGFGVDTAVKLRAKKCSAGELKVNNSL